MELTPEQLAYLPKPAEGSFYRPLWEEYLERAIQTVEFVFGPDGNMSPGVTEDVPPTVDQIKYRLLVYLVQEGGFGTDIFRPYRRATGQE